ncbi:aldo/keto reductase [Pelagerythrobacter aerophilus]|uniref:Aldo/keto reductase n=1 Tax=Pelagerythrobacter aerophilus TaxID=2306995 RepID=A0A418NH61_9SPHN|nr:aldo/keto reductase [Pelagerythrobacter aerophilus]RIV77920.1 aldo/keto reductase [Pelagerythrobacter aerophilus]
MTKRALAGREANAIGLGCMNVAWAYGTPPSRSEAVRLFRRALDLGYNHFDTANIYGKGASEEILGEAIMDRRDEFLLASKAGIVVDGARRGIDCSPDTLAASIDASLKRLNTDRIDLFYMHRFDPKVPIADSVGALAEAIAAGKIGAYGVSEWSAAHIREAHAAYPMAAVQTEYSPWTRNVELGVLDATRELGIALVAFSPVARGALAGALGDPLVLEEMDLRATHPRFSKENWRRNMELIRAYGRLADEAGVTAAQLSLAWVLSRGDHLHAIPGTTNTVHLAENLAAADVQVSVDVLARAGEIVNQRTVSGHRYPEVIRETIDTEDFHTS